MSAACSGSSDNISPSFDDTEDFTDADRGFITSLKPCVVKNARGDTIWNNDEYDFVNQQPCPTTVNPKLWRQAQLLSKQGLYRISPSIYQVRGFDISHITFVEGHTGIVVIDPLISCECAAAALLLYQKHRGDRPVKALIYTHSHIDHFGGAAGILTDRQADDSVPIIAPEHFLEEATSENIFAGPIMRQRATFMYGTQLPRSALGQIGVGLGMGTSRGTTSLIPPTVDITHTGQTLTIDGVTMVFQMVPNTEAPAELNVYFPDQRALLIAECATHALHNIITLRGAVVRDAKAWSRYLDEALMLYCEDAETDVQFGSHSWPTWGNDKIRGFIEEQRDLYAYIHDQTVRRMNQGWNGTEIAERMELPAKLRRAWHTQGFYGSVSHNVKGIYQRYMTWFDGAAENLWKWPPKEEGIRYVACMGGAQEVLKKAHAFMDRGDLRFAATLLGHAVAAGGEADTDAATQGQCREMLAVVFEKLGFGAENATWRNFYLSQSMDLKTGKPSRAKNASRLAPFAPDHSVEQWLGSLSIRIDGEAAGKEERMRLDLKMTDSNELWTLILSNGALTYRRRAEGQDTDVCGSGVRLALTKGQLWQILSGSASVDALAGVEGNLELLIKLLSFASINVGVRERKSSHI
ncbi:hypothetical protein CLAIMM_08186 [Cladophialophora immunda]|nr:hypothetical protein CLAIMM_08186 [Cladophialophora immunda]